MLAYQIKESKMGDFGFNTLNLYTNHEIYFSGFSPTELEVEKIGVFVQRFKTMLFSNEPLKLFLNKSNGSVFADLKVYNQDIPFFTTATGASVDDVVVVLQRRLMMLETNRQVLQ